MKNNELRDTFTKFYFDAKTYINYYKQRKESMLIEQGRSTEEIEHLNKELEWLEQAYNKVMIHFLDESLKEPSSYMVSAEITHLEDPEGKVTPVNWKMNEIRRCEKCGLCKS